MSGIISTHLANMIGRIVDRCADRVVDRLLERFADQTAENKLRSESLYSRISEIERRITKLEEENYTENTKTPTRIEEQQFEEATEKVRILTKRPTDEELLELYAFFKQATIGDCNTKKPGMMDLKGKKKWEFWNNKKGTSKETAQQQYFAFVNKLLTKYA